MITTVWLDPETQYEFVCRYEWETEEYNNPGFKPYVILYEVYLTEMNNQARHPDIYHLLSAETIQQIEIDITNEALQPA
jgi:hypothetical protein